MTHGACSAVRLGIELRRALVAGGPLPHLRARADTLLSRSVRGDAVCVATAVPSIGALDARGVPDPARCALLTRLTCEAGSAGADAARPDVVGSN